MEWQTIFQIQIVAVIKWMAFMLGYFWLHSLLLTVYKEQRQAIQQIGLIIVCSISLPLIQNSFETMLTIIGLIETGLKALLPIVVALFTVLQVLFTLGAWSAPFVVVANGFLLVCKQFLVPLLYVVFLLQIVSRIATPFSLLKASTFLKRTIFSAISIALFLMTSFVAFSTAAISSMSTFGQTAKKLLEQNIPLIGSLLNEGLLMMKQFVSIPLTISGAMAVGALLISLSIPVMKLFILTVSFYLMSAVSEPLDSGQISNLLEDFGAVTLLMCGIAIVVAIAIVCNSFLLFVFLQWMTGRVL
mgnify:CR=1 FL=1